jgi:hypothetical protein
MRPFWACFAKKFNKQRDIYENALDITYLPWAAPNFILKVISALLQQIVAHNSGRNFCWGKTEIRALTASCAYRSVMKQRSKLWS